MAAMRSLELKTSRTTHIACIAHNPFPGNLALLFFVAGGDPSAGVKQLAGGSLDMLLNSTSLYATFNPKFSAIAIPYLFKDSEQLRAYLDSLWSDALAAFARHAEKAQ